MRALLVTGLCGIVLAAEPRGANLGGRISQPQHAMIEGQPQIVFSPD
jgi:hypothetical protein